MSRGKNPYAGLPDHQFWRKAIAAELPHAVDPVVKPRFVIRPSDRVATAGSCFAQHISRALVERGFAFFVTEPAPEGLDPAAARALNYGVFSARFGNVYTTRQLLQLFERACGTWRPVDDVWARGDGRLVDPFRPAVEPAGFAGQAELHADRERHLAAVRRMFQELDVFVFTLGLTEAWRSRRDGAVFPVAPGVSGGAYDPVQHEFVNFEVEEVVADFSTFLGGLRRLNPRCRVLLTVSPVPLVATYEDRHVLVSTTYSKSVLRVAADKLCRAFEGVDYFPSYELFTGNFNAGRYFDADLRNANELGVDHAMRLFLAHYAGVPLAGAGGVGPLSPARRDELQQAAAVVCDEEAIADVSGR